MRHATWQKIEASPFWHRAYRRYRSLPPTIRAPLRRLALPHWQLASYLVRMASGGRVVSGPFRGMALALSPLSRRHLCGYLLGSQECELHSVIETLIGRGYRTIVNVGAGDGYYAVGMALRAPNARIVAFEALEEYRSVTRHAAEANAVSSRLSVDGLCDRDDLRRALAEAAGPVLVLMDVEGAEMALLDPSQIPRLQDVDILVETHDAFKPGCTDALISRFQTTHLIEQYSARPRVIGDFPADFLPVLRRRFPRLAVDLMDERRTGAQRWLLLSAASHRAAGS